MRPADLLQLAAASLVRARLRSVMMLVATAIGVAAVVVLTSLGEGARRYVTGEFQALGTDLLIVLPGRSETTGLQPGMFAGETPRDLTLEDARALLRVPGVERIAPLVVGKPSGSTCWRSTCSSRCYATNRASPACATGCRKSPDCWRRSRRFRWCASRWRSSRTCRATRGGRMTRCQCLRSCAGGCAASSS